MNIILGCSCGHAFETEMTAYYDFLCEGEGDFIKIAECPECKNKYRIRLGADICVEEK